ncbi:MAG: CvpA family protein [Oscillospiraceae bacterium]|nr:CvpA family protein [Oscillospiraceae bacterium]
MNIPNAIIVDIVAVAIVLVSALIGRRRGFIKTLSWIIAVALSFSLASYFADIAAPVVSEKYVVPHLTSRVEENIETDSEPAPQSPGEYSEFFKKLGIPESIVTDATGEISKVLTQSFTEPLKALTHNIAYKLTRTILFVIFFLILLLVISLLLKIVNLAAKIPGLNFINKLLGLILGLILGYLIVIILSLILTKTGTFLTGEILEETVVLKFLCSFFPLI